MPYLILAFVSYAVAALGAWPASSSSACQARTRHIHCHLPGGANVERDSDPNSYFYNSAPGVVFYDARTGELVTITGNCEITCHP